MKHDFLIVGAGPFGCVSAYLLTQKGFRCKVIDRRSHIAGNCYDFDNEFGEREHKYGPHYFHTNNHEVWQFVNQFDTFVTHELRPKTVGSDGNVYSLPFTLQTFYEIYGAKTPVEAMKALEADRELNMKPRNLEEHCVSMVGRTVFNLMVRDYTEKQWGRPCHELPASIIKRLPVRYTWDSRYFNDRWQGMPERGYTNLFEQMLWHVRDVELNCDYMTERHRLRPVSDHVIFTGPIDEFFDYKFGLLPWRSLDFKRIESKTDIGTMQMNQSHHGVPYTRVLCWRHEPTKKAQSETGKGILTYETPAAHEIGREAYYPLRNDESTALHNKYVEYATSMDPNVHFQGRLGRFVYYDMWQVIASAMNFVKQF